MVTTCTTVCDVCGKVVEKLWVLSLEDSNWMDVELCSFECLVKWVERYGKCVNALEGK